MAGRPKNRQDRINTDVIVDAALEIAQHRLADLTMRSLSDKLQVTPGALYKHVSGREELVTMVVEKVLSEAPRISPDGGDCWLALRAQMLGMQALVDRYPGLDMEIVSRSPESPQANLMRRGGMDALQAQGLSLDEAVYVYRAVTYLWLGARVAVQGRARNKTDIDTFASALDILLSGLKTELGERAIRESKVKGRQ
ncbi:TetR/AcrR family transcriptional regulator [Mycobacterium sp. NBC_00419]|uniref:TetR/AcrR family transcriptional regulator n=1 Tax=Mycobacterium sp. NBC_00419 TaxID=2975989 RepID=UPI002E1A9EFA